MMCKNLSFCKNQEPTETGGRAGSSVRLRLKRPTGPRPILKRLAMETEIPASVNRAHRHFIVDDEVVISRAAPAPPAPSTPPNQAIANSLESTFMRTFGRFGQARIRSPSLTRREATESEALQEAEMEARRNGREEEPRQPKVFQQPKLPQFSLHKRWKTPANYLNWTLQLH
jgi:hypothetical protein